MKSALLKFSNVLQRCVAHWAMFRKLGFSADDLFVALSHAGDIEGHPMSIYMRLVVGDNEFNCLCGPLAPMDEETLAKAWRRLATTWVDATEDERQELVDRWYSKKQLIDLGLRLTMKGFAIPNLTN